MDIINAILQSHEGKTLEFKENITAPQNLIKTIVAFANTAGGTIVIGIKDKTKAVIGVKNILHEEERLTNIIADSIEPLLIPDIEITTFRNRELLIIKVPHLIGPYYVKSGGIAKGIYIRLGSTNRLADNETSESLKRLSKNISFDELPCINAKLVDLDQESIPFPQKEYAGLGLLVPYLNKSYPSNGAILMFGKQRNQWFPDAIIRCVRFAGTDKSHILDQKDINDDWISAIHRIIAFIEQHSSVAAKIGRIERADLYQYPPIAIREAVVNALLHSDYAIKGASIQIAIFANRIEITNPGHLPFGQTIESALSGISRLRNRVIGQLFRKLKFVEKLGSGLQRIINTTRSMGAKTPHFEEINNHFRITLFPATIQAENLEPWQTHLITALSEKNSLGTKAIAAIWHVTSRTARTRLNKMQELGLIKKVATAPKDPKAVFILGRNHSL